MANEFSPALQEEITYRFELMVDSAVDEGESAPTLDDATLYQIFQDMETTDAGYGVWKKEILNWLIEKNVYTPHSKEDLKSIQVSRGRKYDFRRGSVYYIFNRGVS